MNVAFVRFISRVLIACMIVLPFQAQAGLIGTDQSLSAAQAIVARATVTGFLGRAEVAQQLQAFGLSSQDAQARVAALSDREIATLAGRIDEQPAGAFGGAGLGLLLIAIFLLWRFVYSDQAQAEAAKKTTTPEKK